MDYKTLLDDDLIEKTYLYSYKKLRNKADAEDLAHDIFAEVLAAIYGGRNIGAFYSWFWKLAHNRYCVFLSKKNKTLYTLSVEGGQCAGEYDTNFSIDGSLLAREELSRLNYAISRLSREHREITVMYYLNEMKISEIAERLSIPEGTVKRRLFDMKNNLRKGYETMDKTENTGKSAYAPTDLQKWGGYHVVKHWEKIDNLILDQIFVACRAKAKTINEIADGIGVAPVYLEKIMEYPLENKFLKMSGKNKYLTDFCVLPAQASYDANLKISEIYADIGKEITDILYAKKDTLLSLDFYGKQFDYDYLLWILYVFALDRFSEMALAKNEANWEGKVPPNNGKDYRIAASFTQAGEKINSPVKIKQAGWSNLHEAFENDKYGKIWYVNFFQTFPFSNRDGLVNAGNAALLFKIIETGGDLELNEIETEQAALFISKGIVVKDGGRLKTNIPVMTNKCDERMRSCLEDDLRPLVDKYVGAVTKAAEKIILPHIREDLLEEYAHWILQGYFCPIGYVFYWAIYEGKTLAVPDDYSRSAAGLHMRTF